MRKRSNQYLVSADRGGNESRRPTAPTRLATLGVAALAVTGILAAVATARPTGPDPSTHSAYTVSVQLQQSYRWESTTPSASETCEREQHISFSSTSKRFWLVRKGMAGKPTYYITPVGQDSVPLYLTSSGRISLTGSVVCTEPGCTYSATTWISADPSASGRLTLASNRMSLDLVSDAQVSEQWTLCGLGIQPPDVCRGGFCLYLSRANYAAATLRRKLGAISPKEVRFGHAFTIERIDNPFINPNLVRHTQRGDESITESWTYRWRLTFRRR